MSEEKEINICDKSDDNIKKEDVIEDSVYIDTDIFSYIYNLIIQSSRYFTKGKGISHRGVNALLLFFLTAGVLYENTSFIVNDSIKDNFVSFVGIYKVPIIFFLYFLFDLLRTIDKVNNFVRRIFQRSEFVYYKIESGDIDQEDLEFYSKVISLNKSQLSSLLFNLKNNDFLTPSVQINLLHNSSIYKYGTLVALKEYLILLNWNSAAVCSFIKRIEGNLSPEYLDRLISKYDTSYSVPFAIGYYHKSYQNKDNPLLDIGQNFTFQNRKFTVFYGLIRAILFTSMICFILMAFFGIIIIGYTHTETNSMYDMVLLSFGLIGSISLLIVSIFDEYDVKMLKRQLESYLGDMQKNGNIELTAEEVKSIINDMVTAFER
ncbi:hypothetical protein [Methanolobus profundi]|uniref:Uncharacterized protein n=1 Tax=Methanolobus profundi TaxID=487685 RepID=A0A1I4UQ22_9EURY|nr:hypothetical protein [Methanolobus profundi]SFM90840.1 hypothetical protein SAMN04488696_2825 [Methanolobus profundi]